jgi:hypothetical protein
MDERIKQTFIDYKQTFGTEQGQRVLKDLMKAGFADDDLLGKDVNQTHYNIGRRSLALRIKNFVNYDLEAQEEKDKQQEAEDVQD